MPYYKISYENKTKKKIPEGFEVHHLDFNPKHNVIENLVALPKTLHKKHHKTLKRFPEGLKLLALIPLKIDLEEIPDLCKSYRKTTQDVLKWVIFRNYLLKKTEFYYRGFHY